MSEYFDYHLDQEKIGKIFHDSQKLDDTDRSIFAIIIENAKISHITTDKEHQPKFRCYPADVNKQLGDNKFKQIETVRNRIKRLVNYGLLVAVDKYGGYYSFSSHICPLPVQEVERHTYARNRTHSKTASVSDYSMKLKNPKWQRRKAEIMLRDNFTCQICGDTETTLNVHHIRYVKGREPWEYEDNELITLCEKCHEKRKSFEDINRRTIALLSLGIMKEEIIGLLQCAIDEYNKGNAHAIQEMVEYVANENKNMENAGSTYYFNDYNFLEHLAKRRESTGIIKQQDNLPF